MWLEKRSSIYQKQVSNQLQGISVPFTLRRNGMNINWNAHNISVGLIISTHKAFKRAPTLPIFGAVQPWPMSFKGHGKGIWR